MVVGKGESSQPLITKLQKRTRQMRRTSLWKCKMSQSPKQKNQIVYRYPRMISSPRGMRSQRRRRNRKRRRKRSARPQPKTICRTPRSEWTSRLRTCLKPRALVNSALNLPVRSFILTFQILLVWMTIPELELSPQSTRSTTRITITSLRFLVSELEQLL